MVDKTKVLHLDATFSLKKLPDSDSDDQSVYIEGYASTNSPDRAGDVIPASVWEKGIKNYLRNPVILAHHKHSDPAGRMVEHRVDDKGLWIKARVSTGASIYDLVKDGVMTAFSVGVRILDAEYNAVAELFIVKELELMEISIVSVPCNQDTLFGLSKSFDNESEYKEFKSLFAVSTSAKGHDNPTDSKKTINKEFNMDPKELEALVAKAASEAAEKAAARLAERAAAEKAAAEAAAAAKAAEDAKVKAAVEAAVKATIEVGQSGTERLLQDLEARFKASEEATTKIVQGLEATLKEKSEELVKLQKSKMVFGEKGSEGPVTMADKETAYILKTALGRSTMEGTNFGKQLLEKAGAHVASATWELEVSLNMESEMRRQLVVASILNPIQMKTNVMTLPVNPEAGFATWIQNAEFGTTASPGAAQTHQLKEITLNAYKLATREYMAYEEEEDALLVLAPFIRDAMIRRTARSVDKAFLLGAGSGADPVKGFATYDATSAVTPTNTGVATIANLRSLRADLVAWGLDPSQLRFIVSTDIYYNLLDDTLFQTVDKVGDKATLLKGQIGSIGNTPVLVSDLFPAKAGGAATASTNIGAICVAPANFIAGTQRGLRFESEDQIETQRRCMVASLRTGMTQLSTVNGMGVSTLRWS